MINQLAVSNIAWKHEDHIDMYHMLNKYNIKNIEIAPNNLFNQIDLYHIDDYAINNILTMLKTYNLKIVSIQSILFGYAHLNLFTENGYNIEMLNLVKKIIDLASKLNAHNIVFGAPKNRIIPNNINNIQANNIANDFFYNLAEYAKLKDVIIGLEANAKEYACNFITTTAEGLQFVKNINHANLLLNYDMGTDIFTNQIEITSDDLEKYVNHVHISAPYLEPVNQSIYNMMHNKLNHILKASQYNKYISLEMKYPNNINLLKESIEFLMNNYGKTNETN
jgi:sugar phosphate isomerase/epimerase